MSFSPIIESSEHGSPAVFTSDIRIILDKEFENNAVDSARAESMHVFARIRPILPNERKKDCKNELSTEREELRDLMLRIRTEMHLIFADFEEAKRKISVLTEENSALKEKLNTELSDLEKRFEMMQSEKVAAEQQLKECMEKEAVLKGSLETIEKEKQNLWVRLTNNEKYVKILHETLQKERLKHENNVKKINREAIGKQSEYEELKNLIEKLTRHTRSLVQENITLKEKLNVTSKK